MFACFRLFPFRLAYLYWIFFCEIGFNTASYNISIWRKRYLFLSLRYVWVLLQPILYSIQGREMGVESLKLISLNVKGNFHKRKTIYTWCRRKNADFSFLQKTHSKTEIETQWKNEWRGVAGIIMSHGSSNSRGVAILIKKGVD